MYCTRPERRWAHLVGLTTALIAFSLLLVACNPQAASPAGPTASPTAVTGSAGTPAPEPDPQPDPEALPEGTPVPTPAAGRKQVVLYTSRTESLIKPVIEAFQKAHPDIEVVLLTGQNSQLAAKLLEERANPQADLFINTDTISMAALAHEGVFEPNPSPAVMAVPDTYRAEDGSWVALTLRARVIMYNTNLVKPEEAPKSMFDLIDPKWKGQIGAADSTNGSMQGQIVAMRHLLGEQKTEEFIRGLVANDTKFFSGHTDVRKAVEAGELKLGLVNHYYYQLSRAEGAPVGVVYPDQGEGQMGLLVNSTNAGIIKGAKNADAARTLVDYLLTHEGQEVFAKLNYEYPVVPGVSLAEGVQPLDQFRLADIKLKTLWEEIEPAKALMQRAGLP
jgi:iron(III) transport system substrate-binding protein